MVIRHADRNQEAVVQNCLKHHSDVLLQRLSDRCLVAYRRESARPQNCAGFNTDEFGIGLDDVLLSDGGGIAQPPQNGSGPKGPPQGPGTPETDQAPMSFPDRKLTLVLVPVWWIAKTIARLSQFGGTEQSSVI